MGNGNGRVEPAGHPADTLLTPHGEREPAVRVAGNALDALLTPHGEREQPRCSQGAGRHLPPNPSWGTGTPSTPWATWPMPIPPNPSWGTGTQSSSQQVRRLGIPPNPSWGTGTHRVTIEQRTQTRLLTPHGEREPVRAFRPEFDGGSLLTPHGERERR